MEKPSLAFLVTTIAADRPAGVHDPVARDPELDRALAQGVAGRSTAARAPSGGGDVSVRHELAVGNGGGRLQDAATEPAACEREVDRSLEDPAPAFEVLVDLPPNPGERARGRASDGSECLLETEEHRVGLIASERRRHDARLGCRDS